MFGMGYFPAGVMTSEEVRGLANRPADPGLVEPPTPRVQVPAQVPTAKLEHVDRAKLTAAALRARRAFPGPVGELVARELSEWAEFGWRLGGDGRIGKLVTAIMAIPFDDLSPAA